jgi:NAD(P)H-dependent flavin oxidoreductase YrpB (nitropropane dioxygenase family)
MNLPTIIQGGMGVAISNWTLAKAVAEQGQLGVISGTGIAIILMFRLAQGDKDGSVRRALSHFPFQEPVQRLLDKYYVPGGIPADQPYKRPPMWKLNPAQELNELTVIANFVEVFLAKEGHNNPVGINLLEKVQMPNMASLYGAMLAGVDVVIIGAGIPFQIPGILDKLANHQPVSYRLDVVDSDGEEYLLHLDPEAVFPGIAEKLGPIKRPIFLPIISSVVLAQALIKRSTGEINGFVIEGPTAGGHNAPPRGAMELNERGEPIYGPKDVVDLEKIKKLGLPFWLAGGYGTPEGLQEALAAGAAGIQVGTAFAYCNESGMEPETRRKLLQKVARGESVVFTDPVISPTGFPFKVALLEGTLTDPELYAARPRVCDIGYLRTLYKKENGNIGFRCSAEPVDHFVKKGGKIEDTVGRGCLCNNLAASAGYGQRRKNGYVELPVITSGDILPGIDILVPPGATGYSAKDVIAYLTGETQERTAVAVEKATL